MVWCPNCLNGRPKRQIFAREIRFCGRTGKRICKDGVSRTLIERYRSYECPRCKIVFHTKERFLRRDDRKNKPDSEAIKRYDEKVPYKKPIPEIELNKQVGRCEVSSEVQDLILKTFADDIMKDIEKDLEELDLKKKKDKR